MTGFGAAEKDCFRVEIRSINHRFMDISFRLAPFLTEHEIPLRNILKERFSRGKFDVLISAKSDCKPKLKLNKELAGEIYKNLNALKSELSIPGTVGIEALMNYKELLMEEEQAYNSESLYSAFREAAARLERMRADEGRATAEDIAGRLERLESKNRGIKALAPEVAADRKKRFQDKIDDLLSGIEFDRDRVLQEIAFILERTDISEEVARVENHLEQFRKILMDGEVIGKRLDFLSQELNREVNTIASKSDDYRLTNIVIEMKSEIEKIREQVQNIQ